MLKWLKCLTYGWLINHWINHKSRERYPWFHRSCQRRTAELPKGRWTYRISIGNFPWNEAVNPPFLVGGLNGHPNRKKDESSSLKGWRQQAKIHGKIQKKATIHHQADLYPWCSSQKTRKKARFLTADSPWWTPLENSGDPSQPGLPVIIHFCRWIFPFPKTAIGYPMEPWKSGFFHGNFMGISWEFHGNFMGISWEFHHWSGGSWLLMGFWWRKKYLDFMGFIVGSNWTLSRDR